MLGGNHLQFLGTVAMVATHQTRNPQGITVGTVRLSVQAVAAVVVRMALRPQVVLAEMEQVDTSQFGEKTNANQ
jgi:hypothetical protein